MSCDIDVTVDSRRLYILLLKCSKSKHEFLIALIVLQEKKKIALV